MINLPFVNRAQAAELLANRLTAFRGSRPLILAMPRAAVPMGRLIADRLDGDLDVILARKLVAPGNPELAVGAVDEDGQVHLMADVDAMGISSDDLQREIAHESTVLAENVRTYRDCGKAVDRRGRVVIVIDDGLASGATMAAALHAVRSRSPAYLVCAVPVAALEGLHEIERYADEVICLATPMLFGGVGRHYLDFRPVSNAQALTSLKQVPLAKSA